MLDNRVIPLKSGFVGVINRGQKDIDDGVSIRQVWFVVSLEPIFSVAVRHNCCDFLGVRSHYCTLRHGTVFQKCLSCFPLISSTMMHPLSNVLGMTKAESRIVFIWSTAACH